MSNYVVDKLVNGILIGTALIPVIFATGLLSRASKAYYRDVNGDGFNDFIVEERAGKRTLFLYNPTTKGYDRTDNLSTELERRVDEIK